MYAVGTDKENQHGALRKTHKPEPTLSQRKAYMPTNKYPSHSERPKQNSSFCNDKQTGCNTSKATKS